MTIFCLSGYTKSNNRYFLISINSYAYNGQQATTPTTTATMPTTPTATTLSDQQQTQQQHEYELSCDLIEQKQLMLERKVGLNLFNKHPPERGIQFLIDNNFIEKGKDLEANVANFLLTRKGLSKQMIGEYLGNLQNHFNQCVLKHFVAQLDFTSLQIDLALRKFQTHFRFPGEAQKIEKIVDLFACRYYECNLNMKHVIYNCRKHEENSNEALTRDEIFILSFAIIMLNTDLHVPQNKQRMTSQQWIKNLRGVFQGGDLKDKFLLDIYERVKNNELKTGADHCSHVYKVQQSLVSNKVLPNLCVTWRRLVCFCRLYEIRDLSKKDSHKHQREIFLFNDLLLVTKISKKSTSSIQYQYRQSIPLAGLTVTLFSTPIYAYGIKLSDKMDERVILLLNARNDIDRFKFVEDLRESILEMKEMEIQRIHGNANKSNSLLDLNNQSGLSHIFALSFLVS
ncbi:IQ motif and SEC7 domain-containing protein 1-like protein [Dinothrombium tinctorium]|uniref:IQ motif and SEC7 domain-containing protein 1-like protein n=1 Tax=Dinothrombium tinctorium TaxID=1965070 RepID=A0A443RP29_9ACAR|nr:IQ motif and SEC7 domain-containing protein 1-like protein [Dinothrombium tinctorium]